MTLLFPFFIDGVTILFGYDQRKKCSEPWKFRLGVFIGNISRYKYLAAWTHGPRRSGTEILDGDALAVILSSEQEQAQTHTVGYALRFTF